LVLVLRTQIIYSFAESDGEVGAGAEALRGEVEVSHDLLDALPGEAKNTADVAVAIAEGVEVGDKGVEL
jgi:hypothetical protein